MIWVCPVGSLYQQRPQASQIITPFAFVQASTETDDLSQEPHACTLQVATPVEAGDQILANVDTTSFESVAAAAGSSRTPSSLASTLSTAGNGRKHPPSSVGSESRRSAAAGAASAVVDIDAVTGLPSDDIHNLGVSMADVTAVGVSHDSKALAHAFRHTAQVGAKRLGSLSSFLS